MAKLGRIQTDADDATQIRLGLSERGERVVLAQMPQEAEDEFGGDAEAHLALGQRLENAVGHRGEGNAARGMGLRIEEDFRVAHAVGLGALQISEREIVKILLRPQHVGAAVIDVEEILQVREAVGRAHFLGALERNVGLVAPRDSEHQLRLEAAFQMQVKLGLGQAANEGLVHIQKCQSTRGLAMCLQTDISKSAMRCRSDRLTSSSQNAASTARRVKPSMSAASRPYASATMAYSDPMLAEK